MMIWTEINTAYEMAWMLDEIDKTFKNASNKALKGHFGGLKHTFKKKFGQRAARLRDREGLDKAGALRAWPSQPLTPAVSLERKIMKTKETLKDMVQ